MEYYDKIAAGYNALHAEEQREKLEVLLQHLRVKEDARVLDIGCGTGIAAGFFTKIIGVDPAFAMLKHAKMPVVCGKGEHLPFHDAMFDGVVCLTAIHHMGVAQALKEMQRVVKKDGWIAVSLLKKAHGFEMIAKQVKKIFSCKEIDAGKDILFVHQ